VLSEQKFDPAGAARKPGAQQSAARLVLVNIAVFCGLCLALYLSIPIVDLVGKSARYISPPTDKRASLPNYQGESWALTHFAEQKALKTDFISYLGWRRRPFKGQTITIEKGTRIRHTPRTAPDAGGPSVYFFGGSTMWGTGADDAHTIPALYQREAGGTVLNFAESGWVAHQSLNQLIKLYSEGHRPNIVVFYDGVNEVLHKCRRENDFWAYDRQGQIRQALAYKPQELGYYFRPVLAVAGAVASSIGADRSENFYDCDKDPRKTDLIAEQLISDWKIAAMIVHSYGGRFQAYLQPVAFFSRTRLQHLRLDAVLGNQYRVLYPVIRRKMTEQGIGRDLTDALDRDAYIYIDFCHVSPNGNALVAARIAQELAAMGRP